MKKFTRTLSLALAGVLVFGLAACTNGDETEGTTDNTPSVEATTDVEDTDETTVEGEGTEETTEEAELDLTAHSEVQESYLVELPDGSSLSVNFYMGKKDGEDAFLGVDYVEHTDNAGTASIITSNAAHSGLSLDEINEAIAADPEAAERVEYTEGDMAVTAYSFTLSENQRSAEIVVSANVGEEAIQEFAFTLGEDAA